MQQPAPVSIRWNPTKRISVQPLEHPVPWCDIAEYLADRPSFSLDPYWHVGAYYVQEASSMFAGYIIQLLALPNGSRYLDLCAAPGGKSTHIARFLQSEDLLVANETIPSRNNILVENIVRWGKEGVVVTQNSPAAFQTLGPWFDCILVDAPCSGSGLFRKMPEALLEWSAKNVEQCAIRQESIVADILPALRPNGFLVYATCSFSNQENEATIDHICSTYSLESVKIPIAETWGIVEHQTKRNHTCYHFHPDKLKGEGFFIAVMQLKEQVPGSIRSSSGLQPVQKATDGIAAAVKQLTDQQNLDILTYGEHHYFIPQDHFYPIAQLHKSLYVKLHGIEIGHLKGKNLIPAHALAMHQNTTLNVPDFPLNQTAALSYLRKSDINLDDNYTGWATVSYNGLRLGWIKKIPHRINNYYPLGYRLRK